MDLRNKAKEIRSGFSGDIMTRTRGDSSLQTSAQETLLHNLAAKDQNRVSILRTLFVLGGVIAAYTKARTGVGKSVHARVLSKHSPASRAALVNSKDTSARLVRIM